MSTVLAVDDDQDVLALLEVTLERGGYDVRAASSADDALDRLAEPGQVDLILLDVMMPGRDGWSLLDQLKEDDTLSGIPVIMVTARGETQDLLRGGVGGALCYITKPFLPQQLLEAVADALQSEVPEPQRRREVQRTSLSQLASLESGRDPASPRPHLSALGHNQPGRFPVVEAAVARLGQLTLKQKDLVAQLGRRPSVALVAADRGVSRTNVYASLRRIHRKLGTRTLRDLVKVAEEGGLFE